MFCPLVEPNDALAMLVYEREGLVRKARSVWGVVVYGSLAAAVELFALTSDCANRFNKVNPLAVTKDPPITSNKTIASSIVVKVLLKQYERPVQVGKIRLSDLVCDWNGVGDVHCLLLRYSLLQKGVGSGRSYLVLYKLSIRPRIHLEETKEAP